MALLNRTREICLEFFGLLRFSQASPEIWMAEPNLHTLAEVAARIRKTPRWLREYLLEHPFGRKIGRAIVFTDADVLSLIGSFELVGGGYGKYKPPTMAMRAAAQTSDPSLRQLLARLDKKGGKRKRP